MAKTHSLNLYVIFIQNGRGKDAYAGWVRKNGEPHKLPSGSKRLGNMKKGMPERVAAVLAANAALRDMPNKSRLTLHSTDSELCALINSGDQMMQAFRKAERKGIRPLSKALHGLMDELARHDDVQAKHVTAQQKDASDMSLLEKAYEIASGVKTGVNGNQEKKRKGRKNSTRRQGKNAAIEASTNDAEL